MQNLLDDLKGLLQQDERLVVDGKLLKNKIIELALQLDPALIKMLLTHESIKRHFFQDVEGVMVFDKIKFQKFVSNKAFLPDSYTSFKNRIGLMDDDEFIKENKNVVLAWPYKDCVLEGGQTKEDQKRDEVFWNEVLAPDEIDRLLEPKVLTNWKRYDKDGEQSVDNISLKDNLIIKGNNLLALHSLKGIYRGKVKLIYIDPPFNTGNDSFLYNDSFNHSTWLTFMKNRLEVAKELLSEDGFIFINVDDIEEAYLKVLCDEIFDVSNFLNVIAVKSSTPSGTKTAHKDKTIIKQKDLILVYRKSPLARINPQYTKRDGWDKHYSLFLEKNENGEFILTKLVDKLLDEGIIDKRITLDKLNLADKKFKSFYLKNAKKICRLQSHKNKEADKLSREQEGIVFDFIQEGQSKGLFYNGQVITPLAQGIHRVYDNKKFVADLGMLLCDFWWDIDYQNTQNEGGVSFPTAKKPELLISRIIEMCTDENDIVLDYHLGSGTTAAVALKSKRRFIGIEQMDYGKNDCVQRLKNVISGEKSGVSSAYEWNGGGSFIYAEIAKDNGYDFDLVNGANDTQDLIKIWDSLKTNPHLNYRVNLANLQKDTDKFKALNIKEQKKIILSLLDRNNIYLNFSEIESQEYSISEIDKSLNYQFYKL